ncbi:hypothetical protein [Nocardioides pocheonensis]|uniref:Uncharacterized protein n=1 Tax=Nocardioides pocheonensis TaxID=661485 RepID=A0A3N0GP82_9ACTN|nr:hypothetical protein [Nocardioides pocheonensis]RNM14201.1 hypothetical protein EFL26_14870 [Nocardioides pocheonensis]
MEFTSDTTSTSTSTSTSTGAPSTTRAIGRWALPAALFLALTTVGSAHGTQAPADHAAEFDPGSVCSSVAGPRITDDTRVSQLVISAHAASIHASR